MRKLCFILLIGTEDQYVKYLPELEAKMMEFLRSSRPQCHGEFFRVMRAIFVSFKKESLYRFFPICFTVLLKNFKKLIKTPQEIKTEELNVYLEACKFLDLFLFLPYDETRSMRWLFISDPENLYSGESLESPYFENDEVGAFVVQEKGILSVIRDLWTRGFTSASVPDIKSTHDKSTGLSKIHFVKSIDVITDLAPFICNVEHEIYRVALEQKHSLDLAVVHDVFLLDLVKSSRHEPLESAQSATSNAI